MSQKEYWLHLAKGYLHAYHMEKGVTKLSAKRKAEYLRWWTEYMDRAYGRFEY